MGFGGLQLPVLILHEHKNLAFVWDLCSDRWLPTSYWVDGSKNEDDKSIDRQRYINHWHPQLISLIKALLALKPTVRAGICERLRSPGIDFEESIPPTYVHEAWRAGTIVVPSLQVGSWFMGSLKGLQIRAQSSIFLFIWRALIHWAHYVIMLSPFHHL
jgi:hypothetical protein